MPYSQWKEEHQLPATELQKQQFAERQAKK
jgi:hypothetical protein